MSNHDVERALIQGLLDIADDRHDSVIAAMETDLNRLRDSWAESYGEQRRASEERIAAGQEATRAWIAGLYASGSEGPSANELPGGRRTDASAPTGRPLGHSGGRQEPNPDPRAAELADRQLAHELSQMSLGEYAQRRAELGVRSPTDMSHLFGRESR